PRRMKRPRKLDVLQTRRAYGRVRGPRDSVWSACVFSAAFPRQVADSMAGFRHRFARIGATNPPLTPPRRGTDSARFGLDAPATGAVHTVALQQLGAARAGEATMKPCNTD